MICANNRRVFRNREGELLGMTWRFGTIHHFPGKLLAALWSSTSRVWVRWWSSGLGFVA
jgi:hypothetical protein